MTAKGIAGGLPLVGGHRPRRDHGRPARGGLGGTYGGNPIACAAALAAIETYRARRADRARPRDRTTMLDRLQRLQADRPAHRRRPRPRRHDRRSRCVEPATGEPDAALTDAVAKAAHAEGVIVLTCGTYGNVIRFLPPLSIPDDLLNEGLDVVAAAFEENMSVADMKRSCSTGLCPDGVFIGGEWRPRRSASSKVENPATGQGHRPGRRRAAADGRRRSTPPSRRSLPGRRRRPGSAREILRRAYELMRSARTSSRS